jgi:5'-3' exonuclease
MDLLGRGLEIDLDDLPKCDIFKLMKPTPSVGQCQEFLLKISMISGCDYIQSAKGVGFKKAIKLVQTHGYDISCICKELIKTGQLS